ncbi:TraX family protein [Lacrimispora sp. 38-1]|uniref:TraX family protein n=1 Tax=Lacrimispora sp. 38-1 TaxID=3125778 RepID=UPI003CE8DFC5
MTTTSLKILALCFMLIDHIAEFIPGIPIWFHWIGRVSAPIFFFCMVWGFKYTHNRKIYLRRMYGFGVIMGIMDFICNNLFPNPYCIITNNIFVTMFLIGVVIWILEMFQSDKKRGYNYLIYFCLYQILSTSICIIAKKIIPGYGIYDIVGALTGNLIFTEGSFLFVFLGVLMYFTKESKIRIGAVYTIFCIVYFVLTALNSVHVKEMFYENYQWMMIGALPFMYLYNGKKGKGLKYLFYIFYPLHVFALFWIGNLCF